MKPGAYSNCADVEMVVPNRLENLMVVAGPVRNALTGAIVRVITSSAITMT